MGGVLTDALAEEMNLPDASRFRLLAHGLYVSFSTFTTQNAEGFKAHTVPGRIYRTVLAFCTLLTISCYVANLAAVLVTPPPPQALIGGIDDFANKNLPCCVRNVSDDLAFMAQAYPDTRLIVVDSVYISDLMRCVRVAACARKRHAAPCADCARNARMGMFLGLCWTRMWPARARSRRTCRSPTCWARRATRTDSSARCALRSCAAAAPPS